MPARGSGRVERERVRGYQYPYAAPIGSEIGVGHRERCRWGEDIAENIAICLWRHRVDAIGGCVVDWGGNSIQKYVCCMGTNL